MTDTDPQRPEVHRVHMKMPTFWAFDPEMWFAQVESHFRISGISSDETKYGYIASSLEAKYACEVRDILTKPPQTNRYETLKTELIKMLNATHEQKMRQLLEREELGDRQSSQFLRHLQALAGTSVADDLFKSIWTSRLQQNSQAILAVQKAANLADSAELADGMNATPQHVYAVQPNDAIQKALTKLVAEIAELKTRGRPTEREKPTNRKSSRSRSRTPKKEYDTCWYHFRFGKRARKCRPPCKENSGNEEASR
ncbi:hypothetical protein RN001_004065 [Aquatica leii]|uniref:DUF7041 domain-containing protein n=1 Tax=Aquatica leii TaxID=1421715 RepID=A0AAN7Q6Z1_9COLE|nr:hypothetical protein RN001_004065 [Aquatica leii]